MKWLETPRDEAERLLRQGLDQAVERQGDEITHRRVWAKVYEAMEKPEPRVRVRFVLACAGVVLAVGAGVVVLPKVTNWYATPVVATAPVAHPVAAAPAGAGGAPEQPSTSDQTKLLEAERTPGHVVRTRAGEHARVALGGGAEAEMAEDSAITWDTQLRPTVVQGKALLTVPHQLPGWRFSVTAGPYVVTVVGTRFEVRVVDGTVGVDVKEGVVEVWSGSRSTRLVAGDAWNGPLQPEEAQDSVAEAPSERPHRAVMRARSLASRNRNLRDAESALQAGDTGKAIAILTRTAQGSGPAAENAAYELGRVTRYQLNHPRRAVALWDKYRTRFPAGLLRTEADLSIAETLAGLGDVRAALAEADAFLARHPGSERRLEVQKLAERLRAAEAAGQR
jgi:hypothetical protein